MSAEAPLKCPISLGSDSNDVRRSWFGIKRSKVQILSPRLSHLIEIIGIRRPDRFSVLFARSRLDPTGGFRRCIRRGHGAGCAAMRRNAWRRANLDESGTSGRFDGPTRMVDAGARSTTDTTTRCSRLRVTTPRSARRNADCAAVSERIPVAGVRRFERVRGEPGLLPMRVAGVLLPHARAG